MQNTAVTVAVDRLAGDPCARLGSATGKLAEADPADTRAVLLKVWDGLVAARLAGLHAAAAAARWRTRQEHAEAVEYDLAVQLAQTCTIGTGRHIPARLPRTAAAWPAERADLAVTEILAYSATAEVKLRQAGGLRPVWEDSLLGPVALCRWLAECWTGRHTYYRLRLPDPPPPWWR